MARPAPLAMSPCLPLVLHVASGKVGPLGMPVGGIVIEGDLGVEGMHHPLGREDEGVDLCQITVALGVTGVQLDQKLGRLVPGLLVELSPFDPLAGHLEAQSVNRVHMDGGDGVGVGHRHILDLDTAFGRQHAEVLFRTPVEGEAGVVLAFDVRGVFDPQPLDHVPLDVETQDVAGVDPDLVDVVGQLDATGLPAATDLHLGLDHHRVAGGLGLLDSFLDGVGHPSLGDGDAEPGEVLLTLVLEEIHWIRSSLFYRCRCGCRWVVVVAVRCCSVTVGRHGPGGEPGWSARRRAGQMPPVVHSGPQPSLPAL
jgi:hypothetical protein